MTTLTCPRCGSTFETSATTNTRCRSCRFVIRVPTGSDRPARPRPTRPARARSERFDLALLLGCGHLGAVRAVPYGLEEAAGGDWICGVCGAEDQRVAAAAGMPAEARASDWLLVHLVEAHPAFVWDRPLPAILNPSPTP